MDAAIHAVAKEKRASEGHNLAVRGAPLELALMRYDGLSPISQEFRMECCRQRRCPLQLSSWNLAALLHVGMFGSAYSSHGPNGLRDGCTHDTLAHRGCLQNGSLCHRAACLQVDVRRVQPCPGTTEARLLQTRTRIHRMALKAPDLLLQLVDRLPE